MLTSASSPVRSKRARTGSQSDKKGAHGNWIFVKLVTFTFSLYINSCVRTQLFHLFDLEKNAFQNDLEKRAHSGENRY